MNDREKKQLERIAQFRPIDDTFFEVLADDVPFCQEILRVLLEDDGLIVKSVAVQRDARNLVGRSVRLDALCTLSDGILTNIEVQRSNNDNHFKRVRYNASCITASETEPGEKFENVPNVIVIYISEFDLLRGGKTAYHIQKVVKETGEIVDDGLKEIYVNTKIDDGTDMGELLQMFNRAEVDNPKFPVFTERMKYLKHSEGGRGRVCAIMEEYARECIDEFVEKKIKDALGRGVEPQVITEILDVPLEVVVKTKEAMMKSV